jgi:hypothetical protein
LNEEEYDKNLSCVTCIIPLWADLIIVADHWQREWNIFIHHTLIINMRSTYISVGIIHAGFGKYEMESSGYEAELQILPSLMYRRMDLQRISVF